MAKTVADDTVVIRPWQTWLLTLGVGAGMGLAFWLITSLLGRYIVEPIACRQLVNAAQCVNSTALSGNIAAVLVGVIGLLVLIRLRLRQPLLITIATAALLWELASWTLGLFWVEALGWSMLLYAMSFGLFAWIARYSRILVVIIVSLAIVLVIRIGLVLLTV